MSLVEYEVVDQIAHIRLNRPEKLNAITDEMALLFRETLFRFDEDDTAQIGIISGNGRSFCAGADVRQRHLRPVEEIRRLGGTGGRNATVNDHFFGFAQWKPLIAAVHGHVMGAGLAMALRCDLVVAAESTQFQVTEARRGLPVARFWEFLMFLGGGAFATDVTLTGRFFSAREALDRGVVARLVADGAQVPEAVTLAQAIMANPPLGVRSTVRHRRYSIQELQVKANSRSAEHLRLSADFRESATAWAEGRDPNYRGA